MSKPIDVARTIKELTLEEKIRLLAGKDTWSTHEIDRLNIPSITTSDGPHGVRGTAFFNGKPGCLLPSATAMGATFDVKLMHSVGKLLATEAKEKGCQVILAPTVCLQRSPLIGRGFEAFGEDPVLSGTMASAYINGVQENGVAVSIKHYAAHDQSTMSIEDSIRVTERTLREMHLLPFQIAVRNANPWSFMTAYHKINGTHASEDPWLLEGILRREWGWGGLIMSDWFGTYSTAEAVNAGLDLEMPGPARWRSQLLMWAILCRKVKESTIDKRVRNVLNLINKVHPALEHQPDAENQGDTEEKRQLCRQVAGDSIVLLKNERSILPLDTRSKKKFGLIGPAVRVPAVSGGGSADLVPYYVSTPLDAITEIVGAERVKTAVGCHGHLFTPLLSSDGSVPDMQKPGYLLEWFQENFEEQPTAKPLHTTTTTQAQMYFADSLPKGVPDAYWLRVRTVYTAPKTTTMQLGLCVIGKGKLWVDGEEMIDLFNSQPKKTLQTPMFNQASMEVVADIKVEAGKVYQISVFLRNEAAIPGIGALSAGGLRIGCCEKIDPVEALDEAVLLAKTVDVPIIMAGLNADYESEAVDRESLDLPPGIDHLIQRILEANPNTIVVTQSGCPIAMPWIQNAATVVHAWFGGQETGHAIADVLFGRINPSGRLSVTFPSRLEDTPAFLTFGKGQRDILYGEGVFIGHRYYEKLNRRPLFYFGYGLSYTSFEYSNLHVPKTVRLGECRAGSFDITVDVRNYGRRDGWEVVQVYIQDVEAAFDRPCKELKAFNKVWVATGSTVTVRVSLDKYSLSYWNEELEKWLAEKGTFRVIISQSADPEDEILSADFELEDDYLWHGV
ncbi:beta-glucosidase j [Colletotrichum truncatum]|uniref:Beta-glucosidase j n=1 Tax=Colletotrichum truncatum TaxID=5467 RepID=A0ACC3ZDD0_COLTU|nr:beta-glucosidase j [Colletotrichum truncatum]KAF6797886.1 beta-glucosidase j [Colletotrichum truncatum]